MSYDLILTPQAFHADAIRAHFAERPNYEVTNGQATYVNEDTGVYFAFDLVEDMEAAEGEALGRPHVAFSLNFFRPHVFALEAEPEIATFLAAFPADIEDPQTEGMGEGAYSREGFLSGWNTGNRFGFKAIGTNSKPPPPWPADPELLEAIWRWNFARRQRQREIGDRVFVPKVRWAIAGADAPVTCVSWTEGVPTLIDERLVTHVILVRQERPSLKGMLGAITGRKPQVELKLVPFVQVRDVHNGSRVAIDGAEVLQTPQSAGIMMLGGPWPKTDIRILPPEEVCGADLVAVMKS